VKVALDTNVLVSAFATRGLCADVLRLVLAEHELVLCEQVLAEFERVLGDKFRVPASTIHDAVAFLRAQGAVERSRSPAEEQLSDPADQAVLEQALAAGAAVLVTGDRELLGLGAAGPCTILAPRGFWERVRRG
jgi:putative PIN family toxin of toxin-antitoxin system